MSMKRPWMVALLIAACCYGSLALAELTPVDPKTRQDIVFQILAEIAGRVTGWEAQVTSAASYLFWTLGTISLSWTMGMMILKRADLGEFFAEFIRFIFFFGLFYALLREGPNLARLILESMLQLGQQAAGSTIKYQTFIDIGTELMSRADQFQQTGASKEDAFLVTGLCAAILLMLTTMVINLFLVFVAGWFLMYAGIFFLGFGGSRWTSDIAIGYYKAVIAVGIQMFVMALIMGIATDVLGNFFGKFSYDMRFYELMSFLVATFAFMTIFNRIPPLLSGLISGASIGLSQGELGGALRGANGADPFGAGRSALGTAVGGAQKLMAAMAAGQGKAGTDSLMSPAITNTSPPAGSSILKDDQATRIAQVTGSRDASGSLLQQSPQVIGQEENSQPFAAVSDKRGDNKAAKADKSVEVSGDAPSAESGLANNSLEQKPAPAQSLMLPKGINAAGSGSAFPSPPGSSPAPALAMTAPSTSTKPSAPSTESSGGSTIGANGAGQKQNPPLRDTALASNTPSTTHLPQDASNSESQSILS